MNIIEKLPKNIQEIIEKIKLEEIDRPTKEDAIRRIVASEIKKSFALLVYVLGYRDLGEFHAEQLNKIAERSVLESRPIRRLWFWSRGFFKTSLITEAHSIYLILNNPNIRILIVSYSLEVAKKPLGAIRNHFISNEEFRYFFSEYCPKANKDGKIEWGTTEALTVPNRSRQFKEPTLMCAGVGTNITGLHFDWMKIDDLVNKDSVTNDVQIQTSKDYYSLLRPIFDNPTIPREDVIGTIYHFADLHSELTKNNEFDKSIIPAIKDEQFVFPERLNKEGWDSMVSDPSINPYDIQRQWLLRPVDPKDAKFKEEWLKYYDKVPEKVAEYIVVDPASTQKKKSDYTVIERWGVDSKGLHYLLEGIRDKLTSFERIDALFRIFKNSQNLKWVSYEVLGGRHGDLEVIKERQQRSSEYFFVKETKSSTASKVDRIEQRLVGPYNAGVIHVPRNLPYLSKFDGKVHDFVTELKTELLQFPNTIHDDILDAQSQMFEDHLIRGERAKEVIKDERITADMEEKAYNRLKKIRGYRQKNLLRMGHG
jgi:phage terminase large subunit-like protein